MWAYCDQCKLLTEKDGICANCNSKEFNKEHLNQELPEYNWEQIRKIIEPPLTSKQWKIRWAP